MSRIISLSTHMLIKDTIDTYFHDFKNTESAVKKELVLCNFITAFSQSYGWQKDASKCDAHLLIKYSLMESLTFSWSYCLCFTLNEASNYDQNEKMSQVVHSFLHIPENSGHARFVFSNFSALYNYDGLWEFLQRLQVFIKSASYRKTNLFAVLYKHYLNIFTNNECLVMEKNVNFWILSASIWI